MKKSVSITLMLVLVGISILWFRYKKVNTEIINNCPEFENFKADTIDLKGAYMIINNSDTLGLTGKLDSLYAVFGDFEQNYLGYNRLSNSDIEYYYHFGFNGIGFTRKEGNYEFTSISVSNPDYELKLVLPNNDLILKPKLSRIELKERFAKSYSCQQVTNKYDRIFKTIKLLDTNGEQVLLEFDADILTSIILKE